MPASEWLFNAPVASVAAAFQQYAALHDPLLAAWLAELIASRQRERGAYGCIGELADVVAELHQEFSEEHANQVNTLCSSCAR